MLLRSTLQRLTSRRISLLSLLALAIVTWSVIEWHDWKFTPARQHLETGVQLLRDGQGVAAEAEWREATRLDPSNAQAWELLGDYYLASRAWPAATQALQHVAALDPGSPHIHTRLATCALQMHDLQEAQRQAQAALQQDATDIIALKILVTIAKRNGQREEQLKYLRRLVDLQPQDVDTLAALANELTGRYEYDQARPLVDHILKLNPNYDFAYTLRGIAIYNEDPTPQGQAQAEADFKKVLALNPQDVEAHRYLGRIYMRQGKPHQAIAEFEAVGRGRPYASAHFLELANAYRKVGNLQRAGELRRRFTTLKQLNLHLLDLKDRVARAPENCDNYVQLGLLLVQCVKSDADSYNLYHFRYVSQQIKAPEFYLQQALRLCPQSQQALAAVQQLNGAYDHYVQAGQQAIKRHDLKAANWNLAHAAVLRPNDPRTQKSVQASAAQDIHPAPLSP